MQEIKLVFPGICPVKKNTMGTSYYYKDKNGNKRLRMKNGIIIPLHFYSDKWKDFAKSAMIVCYNFKVKHPEITFPIEGKMNIKFLFYFNDDRVRDIFNLYEGIPDILAGNSGIEIKSLPPSAYQIIADDNSRYIGSTDGSRCLLDFISPRTELYISDYKI